MENMDPALVGEEAQEIDHEMDQVQPEEVQDQEQEPESPPPRPPNKGKGKGKANYEYVPGDDQRKAMVRGVISYLEAENLPIIKNSVFKHFGLSRSQGYNALHLAASKRKDPEWEERRGRPSKVPEADQRKMEKILWDPRYEDVYLNWAGLAAEAGVPMAVNTRTLHRTMGTLGYRRCLGCGRSWVSQATREKRAAYARRMLDTYPQPMDWRVVRFSCEMHFGLGLDGKIRVLPKPGEKYCEGCEGTEEAQWSRDVKRIHAWVAVGYGFKSELVVYDPATGPSTSGVLTMPDYKTKILDKAVKGWISSHPAGANGFVLEEDTENFAHGALSKENLPNTWKKAQNLRYYFNCLDSPDLSPLDSMLWPPHKKWVMTEADGVTPRKLKNWDDGTVKKAVEEAWKGVNQERIDVWVDLMIQRLGQVIEQEGRLIPW